MAEHFKRPEVRVMPLLGALAATRASMLGLSGAALRASRHDFRAQGHAGHGFRRRSWPRRHML